MEHSTDFLIIGSGIAGLSLALRLREFGKVTIVTKKKQSDTATSLAQGGIACVLDPDDSFASHIFDTYNAGDGLCHEDVVQEIVKQGPARIQELLDLGVPFSRDPANPSRLHLGQEGGHSHRRIVHADDFTGRALQETLTERLQDSSNITLFQNKIAVDLITQGKLKDCSQAKRRDERCLGAYVLDAHTGNIDTFLAPITVLATGGAGKVYLYTSNPDVATGDGIAMAYRAGARIANLEFVQFHPTILYHPKAKNFLISEALRGEGARLIDQDGNAFMEKYDPEKRDLAFRDVVARAIDAELKKSGKDYVYLDISFKPEDFIKQRFPNIYKVCLSYGIDITKEPIPVVPAAHYMCGGIVTDIWGRTDITGLYAIGETACTGLHGANRLASNSLLEGLVMAHQAAMSIKKEFEKLRRASMPSVPAWNPGGAVDMEEAVIVTHNWDVIRRLMWNYVGIVRNEKRLHLAGERLRPIIEEIDKHYWDYILTSDFVELRNIAQVAELIIEAASCRKESRGGHYNATYPAKDDWNWRRDTILCWKRQKK